MKKRTKTMRAAVAVLASCGGLPAEDASEPFDVMEATIEGIHDAFSGTHIGAPRAERVEMRLDIGS